MNKKLHDAVVGLAIGDALGVPYEFKARGSFQCTDMVGYGTHHQPRGTWSDDTSMVLATLDSLRSNAGKIVPSDMFNKFNNWFRHSDYTAHGEVFDAGIATSTALRTGKSRTGEYDNGNGSLMRILPLAFVSCTDDEIRAVSAITHGDPQKEKSFRNDLLDAVNLGKDTDTVGAVAGGLAGIIYGLDGVTDWVDALQNRKELERYLW